MKRHYLISLTLLLTACGTVTPTESSQQVDSVQTSENTPEVQEYSDELTDSMFDKLQKGYDISATVTKLTATSANYQTSRKTTYYKVASQVSGLQYAYQQYAESESESTVSTDTIVQSINIEPDDSSNHHATRTYLGIDNQVHYSTVESSDGGEIRFYNSGFDNAFKKLTKDLFAKTEVKREFMATVLNDDYRTYFANLAHVMICDFSTEFKTLTLRTDGYQIVSFNAEYKSYQYDTSTQITYSLEGTFNASGEDVVVPQVKPFDEVEGNDLTDAFKDLKNCNYTENIKYFEDDVLTTEVNAKVNQNIIDYVQNDLSYSDDAKLHECYYQSENNVCRAREVNGTYYQYGSGYKKESLSTFLPTLDISAAVFDKNSDGTYSIKKTTPAISPSTSEYNVFSFSNISDLVIKIEEDSITLTNTGIGYKEETVITNIGKTEIDFDADKVETDCSSLTWKDLFVDQPDTYDLLLDFLKDESILDYLPTIGGTCPLATLGVDSNYRELILPIGYSSSEAQTNLTNYITKLVTYGWTTIMENLYGGYSIYRDSNITTSYGVSVNFYFDLFIMTNGQEYLMYIYLYLD